MHCNMILPAHCTLVNMIHVTRAPLESYCPLWSCHKVLGCSSCNSPVPAHLLHIQARVVDEAAQVDDHQVPALAGAVVILQLLITHQGSCFGVDRLVAPADLEDGVVPDLAPPPELVLREEDRQTRLWYGCLWT